MSTLVKLFNFLGPNRSCRYYHRTVRPLPPHATSPLYGTYNVLEIIAREKQVLGIGMGRSKKYHEGGTWKRPKPSSRYLKLNKDAERGSAEDVLQRDVRDLLHSHNAYVNVTTPVGEWVPEYNKPQPLPEHQTELELEIAKLSSSGDGLAISKSGLHVYVVPYTLPGDTVRAKVYRHNPKRFYSMADLVKVLRPSPQRNDSLVKCRYFAYCSGCQFQMLSYADQLAQKRKIVEKAFQEFSDLDASLIPRVGNTIGSPLEYGYRTKLTPHFTGRKNKTFQKRPPIGFYPKGQYHPIDIEECPIGSETVQKGLTRERARMEREFMNYQLGATILLRESTERRQKIQNSLDDEGIVLQDTEEETAGKEEESKPKAGAFPTDIDVVSTRELPGYIEEKRCITNPTSNSYEYVDDYKFTNRAGSFFQNNNSILPSFTQYIRDHIYPPGNDTEERPVKYLLDAYCGSGLFTVTLSSMFAASLGIEIDIRSVEAAERNAADNKLENAGFVGADAAELFRGIPFPPEQTVVVIDPPRKGCGEAFLKQLLDFGPKRVVYVSCNVHTQAFDVGILVQGGEKWRYEIESLQGFDFFPQTAQVEGVAILDRRERAVVKDETKEDDAEDGDDEEDDDDDGFDDEQDGAAGGGDTAKDHGARG